MTTSTNNLTQRFPRKRAFVTGAASGLGLALAESLAREGWHLALVDADAARLDLVAQSFARDGAAVQPMACDVRDEDSVRTAVLQTCAVAGGIDLAIHAAGVAVAGPFGASAADDWRWIFDINVHGVANCCRAVLPHMQRAGGGVIVNVASAASFCTSPQMSAYNAAKAAVVALSETLMQELAADDIQVVAAMPGFFRTRLLESARGPEKVLKRAQRLIEDSGLEADDVAEALLSAVARGQTHFVYPSRYRSLWYLKRLVPQSFQRLLPRLLAR